MERRSARRLGRSLATALLALVLGTATAQVPSTPKHRCEAMEWPGRDASAEQTKLFQRKITDYRDCIQKFAADQNAIAKVHLDAAKAAVDEYNAFVTKQNAAIEAAKRGN